MKIALTRAALNEYLHGTTSAEIGFVPTMGALHAGHLSLVERAAKECQTVVVSIFVNPTQFNDPLDLARYPRTPEQDLAMLEQAGVDVVFMPSTEEVYPEPDTRIFDFGMLDKVMEGASRPGHFKGVAQVVSRLFELVKPAKAYFGEKDFQQLAIIREMVRQLDLGVEIVACPIVRDADGLALSSRNALLDPAHRQAAPKIYRALAEGVAKMGTMSVREIENYVTRLINSDPLLEVIYFEIVNSRTLQRAERLNETYGIQGCVAVRAGSVRLIDNIRFVAENSGLPHKTDNLSPLLAEAMH